MGEAHVSMRDDRCSASMNERFITLTRYLGVESAATPLHGVKRWFEILEPRRVQRDRVKTTRMLRIRDLLPP